MTLETEPTVCLAICLYSHNSCNHLHVCSHDKNTPRLGNAKAMHGHRQGEESDPHVCIGQDTMQ